MTEKKEKMTVIWEEPSFPVAISELHFAPDFSISFEVIAKDGYVEGEQRFLHGRTLEGECVTITRHVSFGVQRRYWSHNFDCANMKPIPEEEQEHFQLFKTRFYIDGGYIGDRFVEEDDPSVDSVYLRSSDLKYFGRLTGLSEETSAVQLFSNELMTISLDLDISEEYNEEREGRSFYQELHFAPSSSMPISQIWRFWIAPVRDLLSIVLGGRIIFEDIRYVSKTNGTLFRDLRDLGPLPDNRKRPTISTGLLEPFNVRDEMVRVIGYWLQRPSVLRGMAPVYVEAAFGKMVENQRFSCAMRLAEAAFGENVIVAAFDQSRAPLSATSIIDLSDSEMREVKKAVNSLSSPRKYPFSMKMEKLLERFGHLFEGRGSIDWAGCVKSCKQYRNEEAHGSLIGGLPDQQTEELFVLSQLGLSLYELAVLDLFDIEPEKVEHLRTRLVQKREYNIGLTDYWALA